MNPVRLHSSNDLGSDSGGRSHLRRDESRPVRTAQALPAWEKRVDYVLRIVAERGRLGLLLPHQWTTHNGSPRCVRCSWPTSDAIETPLFPLPVCETKACIEAVRALGAPDA